MPELPPINRPSIHIVSDGLAGNTFVQAPDGTVIPGVVAFDYSVEVSSGYAWVTLEIQMPHIDAEGELHHIKFNCPCCTAVITHECGGSDSIDRPL